MSNQFYRVRRMGEIYGVSVATIWRWSNTDPQFPRPVKVSPGVTGWPAKEVEAHVSGLIESNRSAA